MDAMNAILVLRGITNMHPADSVVVECAKKTGRHDFGSELSNEEAWDGLGAAVSDRAVDIEPDARSVGVEPDACAVGLEPNALAIGVDRDGHVVGLERNNRAVGDKGDAGVFGLE